MKSLIWTLQPRRLSRKWAELGPQREEDFLHSFWLKEWASVNDSKRWFLKIWDPICIEPMEYSHYRVTKKQNTVKKYVYMILYNKNFSGMTVKGLREDI